VSDVFSHEYADWYDALYSDKDYAAECDLIERLFHTHGDGAIGRVLDLGCGTGNHAFLVARRGYEVVGVERSESMLARARAKLASTRERADLEFHQGDIRSIDLRQRFDAAVMMFAVLGYQLENEDVLRALGTARRHLRPGGLFIFDVWYGPAVLHERPSQRLKVIPTADAKILRFASGEIDVQRHLCAVHYRIWRIAPNHVVVAETEETHLMRYFFPMELRLFLDCCGFRLTRLGAFPDFDRDPDETTWNCLGVAQAV
jgi:SAM-dependent methyltransferase